MTAPWSWKEQLDHWTKILSEHVENLNISPGKKRLFEDKNEVFSLKIFNSKIDEYLVGFSEVRKEAEERLKNAWQNYCETGDDLDANSPMNKRATRLSSVEDEAMLPLPDEVLTKNLGLDLVVVVTKVSMSIFQSIQFG